jgi:hypothetical protein
MTLGRAVVLFPLASLIAGCGAAAPRLDEGSYRSGEVAFRVGEPPASWKSIQVEHATLAWRDETHGASILLDARCHERDGDVPLQALTAHLVMGTTERSITSQETVPFDGREAMKTRLRAKLDGVAMDYDLIVLKKDDCVYDFVYVSEPGPEDGIADFERFVGTFHTVRAGGGA